MKAIDALAPYKTILFGLFGTIVIYFLSKKLFATETLNNVYNVPAKTMSMTTNESIALAQRCYEAMEQTGTDEEELEKVYNRIKGNFYDVRALYNNFGLREYNFMGSPITAFISGTKLDLRAWIKRELSGVNEEKWITLLTNSGIV